MPDELERQLERFGRTLEQRTGEPLSGGIALSGTEAPPSRRRWALLGAAASVVAVVVALAFAQRDDPDPVASPGTTTTSVGSFAPFGLDSLPLKELLDGCSQVVESGGYEERADSYEGAVTVAERAIAEHEIPGTAPLPTEGWREVAFGSTTVRYLDRGDGLEGVVRIVETDGGWRVSEIGQCVDGRLAEAPGVATTTWAPMVLADTVPADPLGLERDGWTLVERSIEPFEAPSIPDCVDASGLRDLAGVEQVHDIVTPPDSASLDVDIQILAVGSLERGNALADAVLAIGRCLGETEGVAVETMSLSAIRASWFRAGPDFALVTVVGEGATSIVLEIENDRFSDELIAELAHRADEFLRAGDPAARPAPGGTPTTVVAPTGDVTVEEGAAVGDTQREPGPGEFKLWVSNQSFEVDPVSIAVEIDGLEVLDDEFLVEGQHHWRSWFVGGLEDGEHTLTATSDSGATFTAAIVIDGAAPSWAVLDHWFEAGDPTGSFTFRQSDEPIYFA